MKAMPESRRTAVSNRLGGIRPVSTDGRPRRRTRLVRWRRRHLSVRPVVAVIALSSLLAPEAALIIDAALVDAEEHRLRAGPRPSDGHPNDHNLRDRGWDRVRDCSSCRPSVLDTFRVTTNTPGDAHAAQ